MLKLLMVHPLSVIHYLLMCRLTQSLMDWLGILNIHGGLGRTRSYLICLKRVTVSGTNCPCLLVWWRSTVDTGIVVFKGLIYAWLKISKYLCTWHDNFLITIRVDNLETTIHLLTYPSSLYCTSIPSRDMVLTLLCSALLGLGVVDSSLNLNGV